MNIEILEKIGLTKSEVQTYLALLDLGSSTTGPIVDKSGAASSKIYEILNRLIRKGLVSYVMKGSTKYFEAASPQRIMAYLKEKEEELIQQEKEIEKLLPQLELKKEMSEYKQEATIYKGMRGLETAFLDSLKLLKKGDVWYVYGVPQRTDKVNYFMVKWSKERGRRGIKMRIMFDEKAKQELQARRENNPISEIRFMHKDISIPAGINIVKDRTIIFPSETQEQPLIIVIDNKEIADSFRSHFELLWKLAK
jgi:sugar-specific transcriptional regulator TrmB